MKLMVFGARAWPIIEANKLMATWQEEFAACGPSSLGTHRIVVQLMLVYVPLGPVGDLSRVEVI